MSCIDCRRGHPCAVCLAHGDTSGVVIHPGCQVHVRNVGHQEAVASFTRLVLREKGVIE